MLSDTVSVDDAVFSETSSPVNPRKEYLSFVMTDAALLHATLSHSAVRHNILHGLPSPDSCTDATIIAVACLALFEQLTGSTSSARLHMDGLEAMVKTRGGIDAIRQGSHARKLTTWIDSCASILLEAPARFTLTLPPDEERPTEWFPYSNLAQTYLASLTINTSLPALSAEAISVYWGIHNVTRLKEMTSRLSKPPEILAYSDMVERLERLTVDILQLAALAISDSDTAILVLFANVTLLHIYMFMREMPLGISFLSMLSRRIRRVLSSLAPIEVEKIQTLYPDVCFAGLARRLCEAITLSQEEKESDLDVNDIEEYLREWL
ncbi:hypothetical protein IFR04_011192 [Cadophora malorum]|uniref:Uncharacterized protein n=1 Tax=Cadophora malorum TaxID=108018 RepID=A0A8H7T9P4_9HELO|nr:hypothetical protein IFR04_011192 [Cadophora malorum]